MLSRLKAPFRVRPLPPTGNYSRSHLRKGKEYHDNFSIRPGTKTLWELEQRVLSREVSQFDHPPRHLDFATGTGRVLGALAPRTSEQFGLDISQQMLETAINIAPNARMICGDFRQGIFELETIAFDLITAFRFFPNAEPALRKEAITYLTSKLAGSSSRIICNNHRNFWSVPYVVGRTIGSNFCTGGMTDQEMVALANSAGLVVDRRYALGVLPQSGTISILPWDRIKKLETVILDKWGTKHTLGYDLIYVLRPT